MTNRSRSLLTSNLVSSSLINWILSAPAVYFSTRYFEQRWTSRQVLELFLVVAFGTNLIAVFIYIFMYAAGGFGIVNPLFVVIEGMGSWVCALLIAYKRVR